MIARLETMVKCLWMIIAVFHVFCIKTSTNFRADIDEYVRAVANQVSNNILAEARKITNYHNITDALNEMRNQGHLIKEKRELEEIMALFNDDIGNFFGTKLESLNRLKERAQSAHKAYKYNASIARFEYYNMRKIKYSSNSLQIFPPLSLTQKLNITNSFLHVPLNIFEYSEDILNAVKWTEALESVFIENLEISNGTLLTSYYGDQSGTWRIFPGTKMSTSDEENDNDFFDCRRRVWYIQASASPKDVVIIIDVSGSMTGANQGIAKIAAHSLIETFAENDFFNVIMVNSEVHYLKPCARFLIQATKENKEAMELELDNLPSPEGLVDPDKGIEEAFKILASGPSFNRTSANCNKAIMLITDGIEGDYVGQRTFEKLNADKVVRAYGFLVGVEKSGIHKEGLMRMACENRGYFYRIETFGNVWDTVNDYVGVMGRPLSVATETKPHYSPAYLDCCGLGMIVTVSQGVFNEEVGLIGVLGTDIPISRIRELMAHENFGAFGHSVIVNNNGFIIFHRRIRTQTGYLPTSRNVLLDNIEYGVNPDDVTKLKKHMIDRDEMNWMHFPMYWLYDNDTRVVEFNANVSWVPIAHTNFVLATILADSEIDYFNVTDELANRWLRRGIEELEPAHGNGSMVRHAYIEKWEYCRKSADTNKFKGVKTFLKPHELKELLATVKSVDEFPPTCNKFLLKVMLTSAAIVSSHVEQTWSPEVVESGKYESLFFETLAGYSQYLLAHEKPHPRNEHTFHLSQTYEHVSANPKAAVVISVPFKDTDHVDDASTTVTLSSAVRVGEEKVLVAVSGMKVNSDHLHTMFEKATMKMPNNLCKDGVNNICLLMDMNAYIVASNQGNDYIGRFVGELSAFLIEKLNATGILKHVQVNDTQKECPSLIPIKSSANILTSPAKFLSQTLTSFFQLANWIVVNTLLLWFTETMGDDPTKVTKWVSCTEQLPFFIVQESEINQTLTRSKSGKIVCSSECNMTYYMYPVEATNLYFLMVDIDTDCRTQCTKLPHKLRRVPVFDNDICDSEQRYRRGPGHCYNQSVPGESKMCGRGHAIMPSLFVVALALLVASLP